MLMQVYEVPVPAASRFLLLLITVEEIRSKYPVAGSKHSLMFVFLYPAGALYKTEVLPLAGTVAVVRCDQHR